MKKLTKKELRKIINEVWQNSELSKIGKCGDSDLYYLGGGVYTGKQGWKEFEIVVYNVLPTNDLKEHIENGSCFCSPKIEKQENGSILIIHNSLDGREEKE